MAWKELGNDEQSNFPRSWDFTADPELDGTYVNTRKAKSREGRPLTFYTFKMRDEDVSVLGGTVLDRNLSKVKEGERVRIVFLGEKQGKNATYKNYSVSVWENEVPLTKEQQANVDKITAKAVKEREVIEYPDDEIKPEDIPF